MKTTFLAAALLAGFSTVASAIPITVNSDWQVDTLSAAGGQTNNSAWTFTVATSAYFRVTDCCILGDTYQLFGPGLLITSTVGPRAATLTGTGFFEALWQDPTYSHLEWLVGPGSYSMTITGDGAGGIPADLGVMLEAVPEPETYALMLAGLAMTGLAVRRRRA